MNTQEIIKDTMKRTLTFLFLASCFLSLWVSYIFLQMGGQTELGIMFIVSIVGMVFTTTVIVGVIRLSLSESLGVTQTIGLGVTGLCFLTYTMLSNICVYYGDQMDMLNISTLYLANGYTVDTLYTFNTLVSVNNWIIIGVVGLFLIYYATVLWDYVEATRNKDNSEIKKGQ